jgi:hypothetical protein
VSRFAATAASILETAEAGDSPTAMTILVAPDGGLRLISNSDWALDRLQADTGAAMAYRVTRTDQRIRLEGRAGTKQCVFETGVERPVGIPLVQVPCYPVIQNQLPAPKPALSRAEIWRILPEESD